MENHNRLAVDNQPASVRPQAKKMPLPGPVVDFMRTLGSRANAEKILHERCHQGRPATAIELQGAAALVDAAMRAEAHLTQMPAIAWRPDEENPAVNSTSATGAASSSG